MSAFPVGYPKVVSFFFGPQMKQSSTEICNIPDYRTQYQSTQMFLGPGIESQTASPFNLTGLILVPVDSWQVFVSWCSGLTSRSLIAPMVLGSRNTTTDKKMLSCKPMFLKRTLIRISQWVCMCVRVSLQTSVNCPYLMLSTVAAYFTFQRRQVITGCRVWNKHSQTRGESPRELSQNVDTEKKVNTK